AVSQFLRVTCVSHTPTRLRSGASSLWPKTEICMPPTSTNSANAVPLIDFKNVVFIFSPLILFVLAKDLFTCHLDPSTHVTAVRLHRIDVRLRVALTANERNTSVN